MRKRPKELVCHQCGKIFIVKCFRVEAACPRCNKKHNVSTGHPTPYRKIKYWKDGKLVEIPQDLYVYFKSDPQAFGFEIGLRAIPLFINPYDVWCAVDISAMCKLYMDGKQLGNYERSKRHGQ
jgi:hypothetical protein